jgi:hypothetical protein
VAFYALQRCAHNVGVRVGLSEYQGIMSSLKRTADESTDALQSEIQKCHAQNRKQIRDTEALKEQLAKLNEETRQQMQALKEQLLSKLNEEGRQRQDQLAEVLQILRSKP